MSYSFLIFGYGVPKNIAEDENYNIYLKTVFNRVFDEAVRLKLKTLKVVFTGGPTEIGGKEKRTEAEEMKKFFVMLMKRGALWKFTRHWKLQVEKRALSTLENFLLTKKLMKGGEKVFVFCEETRVDRVKKLGQKIYGKDLQEVVGVDFDQTQSRYKDPVWILKKEQADLKHALWALKSSANLKMHHQLFAGRLAELRENPKKYQQIMESFVKTLEKHC